MAKRKQVTKAQRKEIKDKEYEVRKARDNFLSGIVGSKQEPPKPLFSSDALSQNKLVKPPYDPSRLYKLSESSGILPQCIDAMKQNVDGFGYELKYIGSSEDEGSDAALREKVNLRAFFDRVNEGASFMTVRKDLRQDIEVTGNGYLEVIRFVDKTIAAIYPVDSVRVRLQALQPDPVMVRVKLWRNGKERSIQMSRRFRRYAMLTSTSSGKIKWFKQFGDPRRMDAWTGEYDTDLPEGKEIKEEASEIIHFKIGNDIYGIPRWVGQSMNILGMISADFVNWDLFENQVVPPLVIMVSGGTLTSESIRDIKSILIQKRGAENFNKVLILEGDSQGDITDKSGVKVDMKEMSIARKEDSMFVTYTEKGEHRVRTCFRLPPLYLGRADSYSKSTADSSKMIAEEQIFIPERSLFDEVVNVLIIPDLKSSYWSYHSKGPRLITGTEVIDGFKEFSRFGIFTINEGIRLANRVLNTDITEYDKSWANYPVVIVIELAKLGLLKDIDEISSMTGELGALIKEAAPKDPESAAKIYSVLSSLRGTLMDIADSRDDGNDEEKKSFFSRDDEKEEEKRSFFN